MLLKMCDLNIDASINCVRHDHGRGVVPLKENRSLINSNTIVSLHNQAKDIPKASIIDMEKELSNDRI